MSRDNISQRHGASGNVCREIEMRKPSNTEGRHCHESGGAVFQPQVTKFQNFPNAIAFVCDPRAGECVGGCEEDEGCIERPQRHGHVPVIGIPSFHPAPLLVAVPANMVEEGNDPKDVEDHGVEEALAQQCHDGHEPEDDITPNRKEDRTTTGLQNEIHLRMAHQPLRPRRSLGRGDGVPQFDVIKGCFTFGTLRLRGVRPLIKKHFFPTYQPPPHTAGFGAGNGLARGKVVDEQVDRYIMYDEEPSHPFAKHIALVMKTKGWNPQYAYTQVPVGHKKWRVGTAVDLVVQDPDQPGGVILVEIKCGHYGYLTMPVGKLLPPFDKHDNHILAHAFLQLRTTAVLFKHTYPHVPVTNMFVLNVWQGKGAHITGPSANLYAMPAWVGHKTIRNWLGNLDAEKRMAAEAKIAAKERKQREAAQKKKAKTKEVERRKRKAARDKEKKKKEREKEQARKKKEKQKAAKERKQKATTKRKRSATPKVHTAKKKTKA